MRVVVSRTVGVISPASINDWNLHTITTAGIAAALYSAGLLAPPPSGGARSNLNYFLTGVTVSLGFDDTFISTANGWSVQLNCYSENKPTTISEWQQYVIYSVADSTHDTRNVYARIDNRTSVNVATSDCSYRGEACQPLDLDLVDLEVKCHFRIRKVQP